jgi:SAM-dependent methyltransferase
MATEPIVTTADGRLPEGFGATRRDVDPVIGPGEQMPSDDLAGYLATGQSALKAVRLAMVAARAPEPTSILDLPCGHGRVLRWLAAAYPNARLTAGDLLADGVDFCAEAFGAQPVHSVPDPDPELFDEHFDLIWVGSLFTHLDVASWDRFFALFDAILAPGGVLVFTTHGELVAERMRRGHHYGYPPRAIERTLRTFAHTGFAFLEESPTQIDYGITIARPAWVVDRVTRTLDLRLALYTEALWANHQDVVAVVKRPNDPSVADRPAT